MRPLPSDWSPVECAEDFIWVDGLRLYRVGLASSRAGLEATGAAADTRCSPAARAEFELLERVSLLEAASSNRSLLARRRDRTPCGERRAEDVFPKSDAPARWAYSRSNGIALHATWRDACERAEQELVERDRVLRAWLGLTAPRSLGLQTGVGTTNYEWLACLFPAEVGDPWGDAICVAGVFGFPRLPDAPCVAGYAARATLSEAKRAATAEALQQLAFLWGEPLPSCVPPLAPTPMFHLDTAQVPERRQVLRAWLQEGHQSVPSAGPRSLAASAEGATFVDLTPAWLVGHLCVVRAMSPAVIPLAFGVPPWLAHLPSELQIHPIA